MGYNSKTKDAVVLAIVLSDLLRCTDYNYLPLVSLHPSSYLRCISLTNLYYVPVPSEVRVTRTSLKTGGVLRCSGRVSSSKCSAHNVILENPSSFTLIVKLLYVLHFSQVPCLIFGSIKRHWHGLIDIFLFIEFEDQTTQWLKQKYKRQTTIYKTYIYNKSSSKTNPTKNRGCTQVLRKFYNFASGFWNCSNSALCFTIIAHSTTYQIKRHLSGFSSNFFSIRNVPCNNVFYILTKNENNFSFICYL
jgi:hypothetical protein